MTISLRRAEPGDADFLVELVTDDETLPFLGPHVAADREAVLAEIGGHRERPDEGGWFVVEVDGERAGCVGFRRASEHNRIADAGRFAIHPRFRGRGIADEAARAFQRHLLLDLGFHRVEIQVYAFNERALAHAERAGYVREGVKRKAYLRHGEWQDAVLFSVLREDLTGD